MGNYKRGVRKNKRAGCLMCKPHKANGARGVFKYSPGHKGMGKLRALNGADRSIKEDQCS